MKKVKIGLISRLDYGGPDCREGLWRLAAEIFQREEVNFIVLVAGLVDHRELLRQYKLEIKGLKKDKRIAAQEQFIERHSRYLIERLPIVKGVKIYLVLSSAYDGWIGEEIGNRLSEGRKDISRRNSGAERFYIKQLTQILGVYTPKKSVWLRGDYISTPVERVLKDEIKRSTRGLGDFNLVGGFGVFLFNPGASTIIKKPYVSIPALSKPQETRVVENQIGILILEAEENFEKAIIRMYNFKDLASQEYFCIEAPKYISKIQKSVIEGIKQRGPMTIGLLEDFSGYKRETLKEALKRLEKRSSCRKWPGVILNKSSKCYEFQRDFFERRLNFKFPTDSDCQQETLLGFSCIHAGSTHTDIKFFIEEIPKIILDYNINIMVGLGDFIQGLKHDLMLKGEVLIGFNYTLQEKLAAFLCSEVILKVFREKIKDKFKKSGQEKQEKIEEIVKKCLINFIYITGNHDEWEEPLGFDCLNCFDSELKRLLIEGINEILAETSMQLDFFKVNAIVREKIKKNWEWNLTPEMKLSFYHPHKSATKTTSIRPQEMLQKSDNQIVLGGNFHTAELIGDWDFNLGQRICLQLGTIMHKSRFEESKLKTVDFGIGILKVIFHQNKIIKIEAGFFKAPTKNLKEDNKKILEKFHLKFE